MKERYELDYGDFAPVALAQDLMRGDPATFKQGYSAPNAALAAQEVFNLTNDQTDDLCAVLENAP